ncbi:MAG: alpha/beta fold hydrolase [Candidatus Rokubacteria bacterium]|nr:alpha/beta fold hydrolase [Candidatus Rokubacteria bacterium]
MTRRLFVNDVHLRVRDAGDGTPPLLLLHGLGGSLEIWDSLIPHLEKSQRVIAGDHRGHGGSDKPSGPYSVGLFARDWIAAMDALGIDRADLLGLSLGGAVAMRIAADHPSRVRALVLVDTWALPHPDFTAMLRERLAHLSRGDMRAYAEAAIPQVYSESFRRGHPDAIDAYRARVAEADPASLRAAVQAALDHDMRGDLRRIGAPTLVVVGADDRLTPPFHAEYLGRSVPGAQLVVVPGSGHFPFLEAPREFLDAVLPFLRGR